jgi:hypothetical protein
MDNLQTEELAAWRIMFVKYSATESTFRKSCLPNDRDGEALPLSLFYYPICIVGVLQMGCYNVNVNWVMVSTMKIGKDRPFKVETSSWTAKCEIQCREGSKAYTEMCVGPCIQ